MDNTQIVIAVFVSVILATACASRVGETCEADSDCSSYGQYCSIYSKCTSGQCKCKTDYKTVNGGCEIEKKIGDSCDGNSHCPETSFCINYKCACNSGSRASETKLICVDNTRKIVGERCSVQTDTCVQATLSQSTLNVRCSSTSGVCECTNGREDIDQQCVYSEYGEVCQESETNNFPLKFCNPNKSYQCLNRRCVCTEGNTYYTPLEECISMQAAKDLGEGQECYQGSKSSSTSKWCASGLYCTTCPTARSGTTQCMKESSSSSSDSGVAMVSFSASLLLLTGLCVFL